MLVGELLKHLNQAVQDSKVVIHIYHKSGEETIMGPLVYEEIEVELKESSFIISVKAWE